MKMMIIIWRRSKASKPSLITKTNLILNQKFVKKQKLELAKIPNYHNPAAHLLNSCFPVPKFIALLSHLNTLLN